MTVIQDNIAVQRLVEGLSDTPWEEDKADKEDEEQDDVHQAELSSTHWHQSLQKPFHCLHTVCLEQIKTFFYHIYLFISTEIGVRKSG